MAHIVEIFSRERKDTDKGPWLVFKTKNEEGREFTNNVFGALASQIDKDGFWELEKKKNGKYWNITNARFVRPANQSAPERSEGGRDQAAPPAIDRKREADLNVIIQNRAITAQVCVKASAEIVAQALVVGAFKETVTIPGVDGTAVQKEVQNVILASEFAETLCAVFMSKAAEFVKRTSEIDGSGEARKKPVEGA